MITQKDLIPTVEKLLSTPSGLPLAQEPADSHLEIKVLFTSVKATIHALRRAAQMSVSLDGSITLLVPQVVPYPYPLSSPPVLLEFNERRFRAIAEASAVETRVRIYLCRDRDELLRRILADRSVIVLGGRKQWWPTAERFLAKRLRRAGHEVILTEME